MANPLVQQGTLNRLRGSAIWTDHPELNVTAPFLGADGIGLSLEGESTTFHKTLTGTVTSPEPYMVVNMTFNLLRTQQLADLYKTQMENNALIGDCAVRTDSTTLSPYQFTNCAIQGVRELRINGTDAGYAVSVKGYYTVNSNLWG